MTEDHDLSVALRTAARVAAMSDLRDVRLFEAVLKFNTFPGDAPLTWEIEMTPTTNYENGDDFFVLEVEYSVRVEVAEDEDGDRAPGEVLASVDFKFAALYSLEITEGKPGPSSSELDAYAKTMGMSAVYPYAREFVQNSTSRMGLPPLTLSTFRLPYPDTTVAPSVPEVTEPSPSPSSRPKTRKSPRKSGQ